MVESKNCRCVVSEFIVSTPTRDILGPFRVLGQLSSDNDVRSTYWVGCILQGNEIISAISLWHTAWRTTPTNEMFNSIRLSTGARVSSRCNHTLTPDEKGQAALLFGGWGLGGLQNNSNKRVGAVTLAACNMRPHQAISTDLPILRGRGQPEHR